MSAGTMGARLRAMDARLKNPDLLRVTMKAETLRLLLYDAERMHAALVEYGKAKKARDEEGGGKSFEVIKAEIREDTARAALSVLAAELAEEEK